MLGLKLLVILLPSSLLLGEGLGAMVEAMTRHDLSLAAGAAHMTGAGDT